MVAIAGALTMEQSRKESGGFFSGVLKMAAGGAIGQAIMFCAMPALTRWYSPEDFGALAVFTGLTTFLVAMASFRLEMAIPLPEEIKHAADLTSLSLFLVLVTSLASALGVKWFGEALSAWVGAPTLMLCLWFLPLAVFGSGCCQALGYWIARRKDYSLLGASKTVQLAGQAAVQLGGGAAGLGVSGLVLGFSTGPILALLLLLGRSGLTVENLFSRTWGKLASTYRNFFLFTTWAALIDVAGLQLSALLFARCFSLDVAGQFALAMRILSAPGILIGAAVSQVFYPLAAEHGRKTEGARDLVKRTASSLCLISLAIFPLIAIHGPALFEFVFGPNWKTAGSIARLLSPFLMLSFTASPVCTVLFIMGQQRQSLFFSCWFTANCIGSILVGAAFDSLTVAVLLFSTGGAATSVVYLARVFRLVGSSLGSWFRETLHFLLPGAALIALLYALSLALPPLISFLISAAAMGGFVLWFRTRMPGGILQG